MCITNEARLKAKELENNKLMKKINRPKEKYNDHDCQYCQDSNHTGFCSFRHEVLYFEIMNPVNTAMGR